MYMNCAPLYHPAKERQLHSGDKARAGCMRTVLGRMRGTDMNKTRILHTLFATTVIGGALVIAPPAFALAAPPAKPKTGDQTQPQAGPVEGSPSATPANGEGGDENQITV